MQATFLQHTLYSSPTLVSQTQGQNRGPTITTHHWAHSHITSRFGNTNQTKVLFSEFSSSPPWLFVHPMCTSKKSAQNFNSQGLLIVGLFRMLRTHVGFYIWHGLTTIECTASNIKCSQNPQHCNHSVWHLPLHKCTKKFSGGRTIVY